MRIKRRIRTIAVLILAFVTILSFQNCAGNFQNLESQVLSKASSDFGSELGQVTLGWDPNTEPSLSGYKVYYGTSPNSYTQSLDVGLLTPVGGLVKTSIPNLVTGRVYYFSVVAYDSAKAESDRSSEVSQLVK